MSRIPYVTRIDGRYRYRRRVHLRNLISRPVTIALQTADPDEARARSALLSARFVALKRSLNTMYAYGADFLSGEEIKALVQSELKRELERAIGPILASPDVEGALRQTRIFAEAYKIARRLDRPSELGEADEAELLGKGFSDLEVQFIACDLDRICASKNLDDDEIVTRLEEIEAQPCRSIIQQARPLILGARADAYRRAARLLEPQVQRAVNPLEVLLQPGFGDEATPASVAMEGPPATNVPEREEGQFLFFDHRRFGDIIDEVITELKSEGSWKGDCSQQRRIMATFAWITGNKTLGSYNHLDVSAFKRGLQRLPVSFRFGSARAGAMAEPFEQVVATLPEPSKEEQRSPKTINRDLSTMSTVAKHLAQTAWKPRVPNCPVLDFAAVTITVKDDGTDLRPPWTRSHMECMFSSPIHTGGGGAKHRLKEAFLPQVWHDAAYYAPLLWYYHQTCREEMCGLRADEVNIDHDVPHFIIQDNDVRGRDGELAGEKRIARKRALPLHPELIRLGFLDYVRAIRAEGHKALFPELYLNKAKRGGAQFYNIAWRYMFDWIADRMEVPRNANGKGPDIHSIRALGSSFYEVDGVNEILRADMMGHARSGTNAKHYSKRLQTEGLEVVLRERLEFIMRYVPTITAGVPRQPLRLLPLDSRSRIGSGRHRKLRSDFGKPKAQAD